MNKLLRISSFVLIGSMIVVLASIFYSFNLDFDLFVPYVSGLFLSGYIYLSDIASIDLFYVLRVFALVLFVVASLIFLLKALKLKKFLVSISSFLSLVFLVSVLLTSSSVFYPGFPSQTISESFLEPIMTAMDGGALSSNDILIYGSLALFTLLFLVHHLFTFIFFLSNPTIVLEKQIFKTSKGSIIAEELSRFVIPSLSLSSVPTNVVNPTVLPVVNQPTSKMVAPVQAPTNISMITPAVVAPIVLPINDPNLALAKAQVAQLKEKIRKVIRLELDKQMPLFVKQEPVVAPIVQQTTYVETKPLPEVSLNHQTSDIQTKVKDIIDSQLSTLEPKTKEMVAYLINEELIKYDALNREVLESFIQEKIQLTTTDAVDTLRQELTSIYEDRIQTLTNQAASSQPLTNPSLQEQKHNSLVSFDEGQLAQMVDTILQKHPLLQVIQVPQQEALKAVGVEQVKQEIIDSINKKISNNEITLATPSASETIVTEQDLVKLKEDILTTLRLERVNQPISLENKSSIDVEALKNDIIESIKNDKSIHLSQQNVPVVTLNKEDLVELKKEILLSLEKEIKPTLVTKNSDEKVDLTIGKLEIIEVVDDYLSHHNLFKDGFSTIIPPAIKIKEAKAPKNQQRTDQFKTVVPMEQGVTRTGKKKIIRIPFYQRMAAAHPSITSQYDDLKNYLLAFKVKSRLSNTGDTFRLHKEEFIKITLAGKALKLYFALNPKSYDDTTIPVEDVSDKKIYRDMPLMFKVKSNLSIKRAKILIDDLMKSKDLAQKAVGSIQWSLQFKKL